MSDLVNLSRRGFMKTAALVGGGLVLGFAFPSPPEAAGNAEMSAGPFLRISTDGTVTVIVNKSEMGQGVYTSLPMLVAEELECDWRKVRVEPAPVAPAYNHATFGPQQITGGSTSVRTEWERFSMAGAAARRMLISAAAGEWGVPEADCRAENGFVVGPGDRRKSFGELTAKAAQLPVPRDVTLKTASAGRLLGRQPDRLDSPAKVRGKALFGIDADAPGMLTAVIARPPVFGAKLKSFDDREARKVPGVHAVVRVPAGVAVAAEGFHAAEKGRRALRVEWEEGEWRSLSTPQMRKEYRELARKPGRTARRDGDPEGILGRSSRRIEAEYEVPFLAHAPMEPLNCFVDLRKGECLVRTGTQAQTADRDAVARITGLKKEQVRLETLYLGGGFGRRANPVSDFVSEAAHVAVAVGKPVKVVRTREDDMHCGYYRPMFHHRFVCSLDAGGKPEAWRHTLVGQSIAEGTPFEGVMVKDGVDENSVEGAKDTPYAIPNMLVELHSPKTGVTVQWWRSVGNSHTAFAVESFIDEVAHAAGKDPLVQRRELLERHPRHRGVLELAAAKSGWGSPLPKGKGRGMAVHESYGTFVAHVAEVAVSPRGKVRVERVVCAVDCGRTVNPSTVRGQMESGITFGLSAALFGEITLDRGRVQQSNFSDYPIMRMDEMPRVEVHLVESAEAPGGVGEPGVPPVAAAVANAVFAACGGRVRSLPMTPDKVLAAMGSGVKS